ncbi:MAG: Inositol 2-dehydrogenase/D-chiro-inositol 3-dehydrogenase [Candidatus Heimdallarchaeota archaeon LC_3]|nr:MAG: Inositol 2-dehydrogenase/D-chiro-inositol 3-dehydrogenase [Candidatus Heimdallarchaeota archaeon LC_3]
MNWKMVKNIAVIGIGRMGRYHCRILSRLGRLTAVCDVIPPESAGKEYNIPIYTDYHEMMKKHPEIKGIIIATPTEHHTSVAEDLLSYDQLKAILIEKPIAHSIEAAEKLKEKVKKTEIKVSVGHIEVYNPVVQRMFHLLKTNDIVGEIRSVLFQRRGAVSDGRLDSIGDVFQDIGIHDFDIASRFLKSGNFSVIASALTHQDIINSATVVFTGNNINCTFLLSREFAGKTRKIEIEGTKATMVVDLLDQFIEIRQLGIAKGDTKSISIPFGSGERIKVYGEPLFEEITNFLDTINQKEPLVDIDAGIRAFSLVEVVRKASYEKKIVQFNLNYS